MVLSSFAHSAMKLLRNVGYDGIEMRFDRPDYYYSQVFNLVKVTLKTAP